MTQSFLETLLNTDQSLFTLINGKWTNGLFDRLMPWVRTSNNWIPLYLFLLGYVIYKKRAVAWKWVVLAAINVTLTDQISSSIFKPFFHRLRPCADPQMLHQTRLLLDHCSGGFSFTSSHAANHFGFAIFLFLTVAVPFKKLKYIFFVWAALISYAQVYVGVHYPIDVIAGALIGLIVGWANGNLYNKWDNNKWHNTAII